MATNYSNYLTRNYGPSTQQSGSVGTTQHSYRKQYGGTSARPDYTKGASAYQANPGKYGSYLDREYGGSEQQSGQAFRNEQGETQYDIARQSIRTDAAKEKERSMEDLNRRLAAAGAGGGMAFKQQRGLEKDIEREAAGQSEAVTAQEMMAQEQRDEAARERQFSREERLGEQAFKGEQAEMQRAFESSETGRQLINQAWQFESKQAFDAWAQEQGIASEDIDRAWQSTENTRRYEQDIGRIFNQAIANIAGREWEEGATERTEARKQRTDYYRLLGQSGGEIPEDLQATDPLAFYAYQGGKEGKSLEEIERSNENIEKFQDAILASAADPQTMGAIVNIFKKMWPDLNVGDFGASQGGEVGAPGSGALMSPDSFEYKNLVQNSPVFTGQVLYNTGSGKNKWFFTGGVPATGDHFSYDGKLYKRTDDSIGTTGKGAYQGTDYFTVVDVATGETKRIDAKSFSKRMSRHASGF